MPELPKSTHISYVNGQLETEDRIRFYSVDIVRAVLLEEVYQAKGSIVDKCIQLGVAVSQFYQVKQRRVPPFTKWINRLHLLKVYNGHRIVGYVSRVPLEPRLIWQD